MFIVKENWLETFVMTLILELNSSHSIFVIVSHSLQFSLVIFSIYVIYINNSLYIVTATAHA